MLKKEDHREIISYEIISKDLSKKFFYHFYWSVAAFVIVSLFHYGIVKMLQHYLNKNDVEYDNYLALIFNLILGILVAVSFAMVLFLLIKIINIKRNNFLVHTDTLVNADERKYEFDLDSRKERFDHLYFARFGVFFIYYDQYKMFHRYIYPWSKNYSMNALSLFRSSNIGDDFYVVTIGRSKKIWQIYNKKMFVLKEEIL